MKKLVTSMILSTVFLGLLSTSFAGVDPSVAKTSDKMVASTVESEVLSDADYFNLVYKEADKKDKPILKKHYDAALKYEKLNKLKEAEKEWAAFDKIANKYFDMVGTEQLTFADQAISKINKDVSFEEFIKFCKVDKKKMTAKEIKDLTKLHKSILELESQNKFEESIKKVELLMTTLQKYSKESLVMNQEQGEESFEMPSYKEFVKNLSDYINKIPEKESKALETAYNKAVAYEKEGKIKEADKEWEVINKTIEKYMKVKQ
jgi:TolA-binding protein